MSCIKSIKILSVMALGIYSSSAVFANPSFIQEDMDSTLNAAPHSQILDNSDERSLAIFTSQTDDLSDLEDITSLLNDSKNSAIETSEKIDAYSAQFDIKKAVFSGLKIATEQMWNVGSYGAKVASEKIIDASAQGTKIAGELAWDMASYGAYGARIAAEKMWDVTTNGVKFTARKTWDLTSYTVNEVVRNGIAWNLCYYFSEGLEEGLAVGLREGVKLVHGSAAGEGAYLATKLAFKAAHYVVPGFRGLFAATSMRYARVAVVDPAIKMAPTVAKVGVTGVKTLAGGLNSLYSYWR